MTIRAKEEQSEVVIDLTGPDGNAFALMGYANRFGRQLGWNKARIDELIDEMTSGDYENLIEAFDDAFGDLVILER